jgi:hypothetical protein
VTLITVDFFRNLKMFFSKPQVKKKTSSMKPSREQPVEYEYLL